MTRKMFGSAFALAFGCAVGLSAQTTARTDAVDANRDDSKDKVVTVVGCVQQQEGAGDDEFVLTGTQSAESDGAMSGGTVGTSGSAPAGATSTSGSPTSESATSSSTGSETSGTSSSSSSAMPPAGSTEAGAGATAEMTMQHHAAGLEHSSYELTGDREDDLKNLAGRRIEITGTVEENGAQDRASTSMSDPHAGTSETTGATGTSGTATGSASGSATGTSGSASVALPRLKITSFREVTGDCAPVQP